MRLLKFLYYPLFFLTIGLYSVPTSAESVCSFKTYPTSKRCLTEISSGSKAKLYFNSYNNSHFGRFTKIKIFSEKAIISRLTELNLPPSDENEWLGLVYLDENGKLANHPKEAFLSQENQKVFKNKELVEAWRILFKEGDEISAVLRKNPENLQKLNDYLAAEGADLTKLKNSFGNTAYPEKWLELKIPKNKLDEIFTALKNDPPANIDPWTPEHKAQRWNNYKEGDGTLDFESWSNNYDGNINKAVKGNKKVKDYANNNSLDIPESGFERTWPDDLTIELRGQNVTGKRRHDIYDVDNRKAIEIKEYNTQNVSKSIDIEREALMDIKLLQQGRVSEIEWVFLGNGPSAPLRALLESGGIKIIP